MADEPESPEKAMAMMTNAALIRLIENPATNPDMTPPPRSSEEKSKTE